MEDINETNGMRDTFEKENMDNLKRLDINPEDFSKIFDVLSNQAITTLSEQDRLVSRMRIKDSLKIILFINLSTILRSSYNHLETNMEFSSSPLFAEKIIKTDMDERRLDFMKVFAHSVLLNLEEDRKYQLNVLLLLINLLLSCKLSNMVDTINFMNTICKNNKISIMDILESTNICFEFFNFSDFHKIKNEKNYH